MEAQNYFHGKNSFEKILGYDVYCDTFDGNFPEPYFDDEDMHFAIGGPDKESHYCAASRRGDTVYYFDSMLHPEYTLQFEDILRHRYPGTTLVRECVHMYQPSVPDHLPDPFHQHHFCYVECIVYLFHKWYCTSMGPLDPIKRIQFIKHVAWCLIHKFIRPKMAGKRYARFVESFGNFYIYNAKYIDGVTMIDESTEVQGSRISFPSPEEVEKYEPCEIIQSFLRTHPL
jgi:hypothetical protein